MNKIHKAADRGRVDLGWLQSNHSFSFGSYHNPERMGISVLRVINDDVVMPGQGFGEHGHQDMEIISYVIEGAIEHQDSTGNRYTVPAGDVQRMSAGSGIRHSEYNASNTEKVNFLQIWIQPKLKGIAPGYEQKTIKQNGLLTPLVTPKGVNGSLSINQDASIYRLKLSTSESFELKTANRIGYLYVVSGNLVSGNRVFSKGDAFSLNPNESILLEAEQDSEAIWFDLPNVN